MEWLPAFILTVALEYPVLAVFSPGRRQGTVFSVALAVNLVSHPLLWFAMPSFFPPERFLLLGESTVALMECALMRLLLRAGFARALSASIAMNLVSFFVGAVLGSQGIL